MNSINRWLMGLLVVIFSAGLTWAGADDAPPATGRRADQAALKPYAGLVGQFLLAPIKKAASCSTLCRSDHKALLSPKPRSFNSIQKRLTCICSYYRYIDRK